MPNLYCACGGLLEFATDPIFGRSIEACRGACGYSGAPRPDEIAVAKVAIDHAPAEPGQRLCPDCNLRPTYTQNAKRCHECAETRHRAQRTAAQRRCDARAAQKRRSVDTHGAAIVAQTVTQVPA